MSVKELVIICDDNTKLKFKFEKDMLYFYDEARNGEYPYEFDRGEAHLLMLYLQEHLALPAISNGLDKAIIEELNHKPKDIM